MRRVAIVASLALLALLVGPAQAWHCGPRMMAVAVAKIVMHSNAWPAHVHNALRILKHDGPPPPKPRGVDYRDGLEESLLCWVDDVCEHHGPDESWDETAWFSISECREDLMGHRPEEFAVCVSPRDDEVDREAQAASGKAPAPSLCDGDESVNSLDRAAAAYSRAVHHAVRGWAHSDADHLTEQELARDLLTLVDLVVTAHNPLAVCTVRTTANAADDDHGLRNFTVIHNEKEVSAWHYMSAGAEHDLMWRLTTHRNASDFTENGAPLDGSAPSKLKLERELEREAMNFLAEYGDYDTSAIAKAPPREWLAESVRMCRHDIIPHVRRGEDLPWGMRRDWTDLLKHQVARAGIRLARVLQVAEDYRNKDEHLDEL